jgi:hypothetical protein
LALAAGTVQVPDTLEKLLPLATYPAQLLLAASLIVDCADAVLAPPANNASEPATAVPATNVSALSLVFIAALFRSPR